MHFSTGLLPLLALAPSTLAALATTTNYNDGSEGACGCGVSGAFPWQHKIGPGVYTAAGSAALFDPATKTKTWCGSGCGTCYSLTNQGYSPAGQGSGAGKGQSIIVMITNLCPYNGNERWCPLAGSNNQFGYNAHFDIMGPKGSEWASWDNPVVSYTKVQCPSTAVTDFRQCYCATHAS